MAIQVPGPNPIRNLSAPYATDGAPTWWDYQKYGPYPGPGILPAFPYGNNGITTDPTTGDPIGNLNLPYPSLLGGTPTRPVTGGPDDQYWRPTTPPPMPGGPNNFSANYRQVGSGPWQNAVNFSGQNWTPDWFRTEHDNDKRAEASRRFRNDLSTGDEVAMQEWETYLTNKMMGFLNPKDAAAVGMGLNVLGNDQGTYDTQNMGFNPAMGLKPGAEADVRYQQRGKWDAFDDVYGQAKTDLFGATTEQDFANDGTLDPFESMDRFVNEAKSMGQKFALDPLARKNDTGEWATADGTRPGKSRLNRWEEQDLTEQWSNLAATSGVANNSPLFRAVQSMVMPTRYKPNAARPAFRVGAQRPKYG